MRFTLLIAITLIAAVLAVDVKVFPTADPGQEVYLFKSDQPMTVMWDEWVQAGNGPFTAKLFVAINETMPDALVHTIEDHPNAVIDNLVPDHIVDWGMYEQADLTSFRWCITDASANTVCSQNFEIDHMGEASFNFVVAAMASCIGLALAMLLIAPVCVFIPCAFYCVVQIAWSMALSVVCLIPLVLYFSLIIFVSVIAGIAGGALFPDHKTTKNIQ